MHERELAALRRDLEEFGFEVASEDYLNAVGLKEDVDTASIYERYAHLHTADALDVVRRACSRAAGSEARRLRFLESDVLGSHVGERFAEEEDALATDETRAVVVVDGETITFRSVGTLVRESDDRERRRRLVAAEDVVKATFLPRVESLERRYREAYAALGYPDDAARWELVHGVSLDGLTRDLAPVLEDTRAPLRRALEARLAQVEGLALREAEAHDVAHMMRAKAFDAHFPKERVVPLLKDFLLGLGFDLDRLPNVTLDLEDRPNKDPRAFVMPARVPQDVRLVTRPRGGLDDYRALFHEAGHLLHFAHTRADLPYEERYFGDDGVTESYAFLFEHLFENPLFLAEAAPTLRGEALEDFLAWSALDKLLGLRWYARMLPYDLWLAKHDLDGAPPRYVEAAVDATIVPASPLDYLSTDGFYGTSYLRAWLFEALHRRVLEQEHGAAWWKDRRAGEHLRALYAEGTAPTVETLAEELGERKVTPAPLLDDVRRLLRPKL